MKHRCRWLYFSKRGASATEKARPSRVAYCWQKGARIREKDCVPCLLTRMITLIGGMLSVPEQKQPMLEEEWKKRHGKG